MRKKRPIIYGLFALCALALGATALYPPWRDTATLLGLVAYADIIKPNDPLTRMIRNAHAGWGEAVVLTPTPLKVGMVKTEVEAVLAHGKFASTDNRSFSWRNPKTYPPDSLFYTKTVSGLPCTLNYTVVVRYDDHQSLVEAVGTENEAGCL